MKSLLLSALLFGSIFNSQAQTCEILRDGIGSDVSGTTLQILLDPSSVFPYAVHLHVRNTSDTDQKWQIKRVATNIPAGWSDDFCWPPLCYSVSGEEYTSPNNPALIPTIINGTSLTSDNVIADLKPLITAGQSVSNTVTYHYFIIDTLGNSIDSVSLEFTYTLNTPEKSNNFNVAVYPTLAYDQITIEAKNQYKPYQIKLVNLAGQLIRQTTITNPIHTLFVSELKNGIYFISIENNNGQFLRKKIIIQH